MNKETNWPPLLDRFSKLQYDDKQQQYYNVLYILQIYILPCNFIIRKYIIFYSWFIIFITILTFQKADQ